MAIVCEELEVGLRSSAIAAPSIACSSGEWGCSAHRKGEEASRGVIG